MAGLGGALLGSTQSEPDGHPDGRPLPDPDGRSPPDGNPDGKPPDMSTSILSHWAYPTVAIAPRIAKDFMFCF